MGVMVSFISVNYGPVTVVMLAKLMAQIDTSLLDGCLIICTGVKCSAGDSY